MGRISTLLFIGSLYTAMLLMRYAHMALELYGQGFGHGGGGQHHGGGGGSGNGSASWLGCKARHSYAALLLAAGAVLPLLLACTTLHELVDRTSFLLALTNVHKGGSHSYDEIDTVLELTYTSGVEVRHFRATFLRCFRKQLRCRGDLRRIFDRYTEEKLLVRRDREEEEAARQREHQQEDKRHQIHSTSSSHRQGEYEKGGGRGGGRGGSGLFRALLRSCEGWLRRFLLAPARRATKQIMRCYVCPPSRDMEKDGLRVLPTPTVTRAV